MTDEEINCAEREGGNAALGGRKRSQRGCPTREEGCLSTSGLYHNLFLSIHLSLPLPSRFVAVVVVPHRVRNTGISLPHIRFSMFAF